MDRLQRTQNPEIVAREMLDGLRAGIWTSMPAIVESFDPDAQTCSVQPAIRIPTWGADLQVGYVPLPVLTDVPVEFPGGGGCTLTFPVKQGDECLLVFGARSIDGWWQSGGVQDPAARRMQALSDAIALVGIRSKPRALSAFSTSSAQLRSDDGATFIDLNPTTQKVRIVAPGGFDVVAPESTFSAKVTINGLLTWVAGMMGSTTSGIAAQISGAIQFIGTLTSNGKRIDDTHTHKGVQTGSGNSGTVN